YFQRSQHAAVMHRHALEEELRRAYENSEFLLHYQPQLELSTGRLVGVEALLRWKHPRRGLVSAGEFIDLAEETGLIVPMGDRILGEACRQAAEWRRRGLPSIAMAVNVSGLQIQRTGFGGRVLKTLQETGLPPSILQIEITESAAIGSSRDAIDDLD